MGMSRPVQGVLRAAVLAGPAAVVLYLVLRYGVNVPSWDQWTLVDSMVQLDLGSLPWAGIIGQHNEHRMIFPKLLMLLLALLTRWHIVAEMLAGVLLTGCSLLILLALLRPILRETSQAATVWASFIIAATLFSLGQWENWLWGWQVQWFLGVTAAVSTVALATRSLGSRRPWPWIAGAAGAAIVCQYSIASGVAVWISGALILTFHPNRRRILLVWTAIALCTTALYFIGYVRPLHHPSPLAALDHPLAFLIFAGNYLSGPLGRDTALGLGAGLAFSGLAASTAIRFWRMPELIMPWIALGTFAGATALLTAAGRVGMGTEQGFASRYATVGLLLTIALVPLGLLAYRAWPAGRWARLRRIVGLGGAMLLTVLVIRTDVQSLKPIAAESRKMAEARECLIRIDEATDECLGKIFSHSAPVRDRTKKLQAFGWSGFPAHASQPAGTLLIAGPTGARLWRLRPDYREIGWLDKAHLAGGTLTVSGWARPPRDDGGGAPRVVVTVGDALAGEARHVGEAVIGEESPLVAAHYNDPALRRSAWTLRSESFSSADRPLRFRAYLVVGDGELSPVGGGATVEQR